MSIARGSGNVGSLDAREFDPVLVGSEAAIVGTIARNAMMPKMAAVVRVEFELKEGVPVDTATTALVGGIGAMKLAIERGITRTAQTGVVQGSVQANIVEQNVS